MNADNSQTIDRQKILIRLLEISERYEFVDKNLKEILENIVEAICEFTGADCAALYPFDMNRDEYYDKDNVATYGLRKSLILSERPRSSKSMAAYIMREGEVCISDVTRDDPEMSTSKFIEREGIQAFMAISPKAHRQAMGLLYVNFRSPHLFTDEEKEVVRLFAQQAGIVIHNAWLLARARQQADTLRDIHTVGLNIVSIPTGRKSLKKLLDQIAKNARKVLKANLVDLYHYIQEEERFDLPPSLAGNHSGPPIKVVYKDDVVYQLVRRREPLFVKDTKNEPLFIKPFDDDRPEEVKDLPRFVEREHIASSASVPLIAGNQIVGVLFINYCTPQTFSEHQKDLINVFATQAAIAIANVRLYEESQQRAEALHRLNTVAEDLVRLSEGTTDLTALLRKIARGAKDVLNADLVDIYQYIQSRDIFPLNFLTRIGTRKIKVKKKEIHKDDVAFVVLRKGQPYYASDAQADPDLIKPHDTPPEETTKRFVVREGILSMAAIPMKVGTETVGVLFVSYKKLRQAFPQHQKELIELFAAQAAVAIHNARMLIHRKEMVEFGESLTSSIMRLTEEQVLELVHDQASELMDTSNMYIALYDEISGTVRFPLAFVDGRKIETLTEKGWQPRKAGRGKTEEIIKTKAPIFHETRDEASKWYSEPGREEYIGDPLPSWMGVPMVIGERVLGVIATYHPIREYVYSRDDLLTLQTIASQAAVAIDNARMYYNVNSKLNAVVRFGESLTSGSRLQEEQVFALVYQQVSQLMKADSMYIALYDPAFDTVWFGLAYIDGRKVDIRDEKGWQQRKAGKGKTEEIIRTKLPILHASKAETVEWYEQADRDEYVGNPMASWMGVPMLLGGRVLGVIAVFDPIEEFLYTSDDLEVLQALANQTAIALDNARRYHYVSTKLTGLMEFGQKITESIFMSKKEILNYIHDNADVFIDTDNMYIALLERDGGQDVIKFELAYRNGQEFQFPMRPALEGRTGEIIKTRKPIFLPTRKDVEDWFKNNSPDAEINYSASWMGVPMMIGNRVLGVIGCDQPEEEQWYNEEDLNILQSLANLAAIALENSQLYNNARQEAIANRQLATLGTAIAALQHRINNTLNIISPNVTRLRDHLSSENDPEVEEILGIIDRNTRYTSTLLSRIQTPLQEVGMVSVDVNAILTDIFNRLKKEWAARTHVKVLADLTLDSNIPVISLPIGQISEVFSNLIDNAYRALDKAFQSEQNSQKTATIVVATKLDKNDTINVRVTDNVPGGIPLAIREKLFDKPVPSRTPGEGSGLGLWLSKLIMQRIGGDISIESTGEEGTTMLVEIPLPLG